MLMPPNVQKLMAQPPRRAGTLKDIKHVVLLMQENRSFDHYFGMLSGVRGFGDPDALMLSTGRTVFHQPAAASPAGYLRSEQRRVGQEGGSTGRYRWSPSHQK